MPLDNLLDQLRGALREQAWKMQEHGDLTDTLTGPFIMWIDDLAIDDNQIGCD